MIRVFLSNDIDYTMASSETWQLKTDEEYRRGS